MMILQYIIIHKIIQLILLGLILNLICYSILNLSTITGATTRQWIIIINDPLIYKSISGPF